MTMSTTEQYRRVMESLTPVQLVLAWLTEAQQYGSLEAYARSTLDRDDPALRLPGQIRAATNRALRGHPRIDARAATRAAVHEGLLAYELVLTLNGVASRFALLAGLRLALAAELGRGRVRTFTRTERPAPDVLATHGRWQAIEAGVLEDLEIESAVRAGLERRYLAGHPALFADGRAEWAKLERLAEDLREVMGELAELVPAGHEGSPEPGWIQTRRVNDRTVEILDEAKLATYLRLGDWGRAAAIAERRLRALKPPDPSMAVEPVDGPVEADPPIGALRVDTVSAGGRGRN